MLAPVVASLYTTALSYDKGARMFDAHEVRTDLANAAGDSVTPSSDVAALNQLDTMLHLMSLQAQTTFLVSQALQHSAKAMLDRETKLRQNLMNTGATFA